jgi:prophage regulatory protein
MTDDLATSQAICTLAYMANAPPPIMGSYEIGEMLGLSRQRVQQLTSRRDFPKPYAVLKMGQVWRRPVVEAWAREHGRAITGSEEPDSG